MKRSYDTQCYDLARDFVDDMDLDPAITDDEDAEKAERSRLTDALAAHIQGAVEDFISSPEIYAPKEQSNDE